MIFSYDSTDDNLKISAHVSESDGRFLLLSINEILICVGADNSPI
jgi:hypothetical protein